ENAWVFSTFNDPSRRLWIGLSDAASPGVFTWANGEPLIYTNWAPGQPSGGSEHWVELNGGTGGMWNDLPNVNFANQPMEGVVEVATAVPEPASLAVLGVGVLGLLCVTRRRWCGA